MPSPLLKAMKYDGHESPTQELTLDLLNVSNVNGIPRIDISLDSFSRSLSLYVGVILLTATCYIIAILVVLGNALSGTNTITSTIRKTKYMSKLTNKYKYDIASELEIY